MYCSTKRCIMHHNVMHQNRSGLPFPNPVSDFRRRRRLGDAQVVGMRSGGTLYILEAMSRAFKIWIVIGSCLGAAVLAFPQVQDDPLDSLKVCAATQHLILENKFVRVIDDQIPVGVTEPMHRHPHGVVVYLSNYTNEQTTQDGKKSVQDRKAGTASWSEATVHTVKTIGATPSHAIRIELKF
jgi:hypothetical protein